MAIGWTRSRGVDPDHWRWRAWVRARGCAAFEPLDDDHAAAAAGAAMLWCLRLIGVGVGRFDGINGNYGQREQLAPPHEGDLDLPSHRQPACGPAFAWPQENGKYGPISRNRGRSC